MEDTLRDAIVVGAGLAGMTAALRLASSGRSVLLIDRRPVAGGRCGTFQLDGHEFTVGCNDFGSRIISDLRSLGISLDFVPSTNVVALGESTLRLPPDLRSGLKLLFHAPSIGAAVLRVKGGERRPIGRLFDERARDGMGFRFLSLLAYALGTPPQALRADMVRADFSTQYGYGHERMVVPALGPQSITDAMVARLRELGADFRFGADVVSVRRDAAGFAIETSGGSHHARTVLTTEPVGPRRSRAGLKVAQILFVVPKTLRFVDARTLIVSPPRPDAWMAELDRGQWPATYGFHVFQDVESAETRTLTGFLLAPRGVDHFDAVTRRRVLDDVERRIAAHVPGFVEAIRYRRLLDPSEYERTHQVSASLAHEIFDADQDALGLGGEEPGIFRIGNAAAPPGDHANAAMLSGLWAADRAIKHQDVRAP